MDILVANFVQFNKILHGGLTKHEEDIVHIESLRAMVHRKWGRRSQ